MQYASWIAEAWRVLQWPEPTARLLWEMLLLFSQKQQQQQSQSEQGGQQGQQAVVSLAELALFLWLHLPDALTKVSTHPSTYNVIWPPEREGSGGRSRGVEEAAGMMMMMINGSLAGPGPAHHHGGSSPTATPTFGASPPPSSMAERGVPIPAASLGGGSPLSGGGSAMATTPTPAHTPTLGQSPMSPRSYFQIQAGCMIWCVGVVGGWMVWVRSASSYDSHNPSIHPSIRLPHTNPKPKNNTQNEIRSEAHHVTFLKKHLKDLLLALKTANDSSSSSDTVAAASAAALNGGGPQQQPPPQLQQRARSDSVSSVGSLDFGGIDLRVTAAEFDALGFLLAGGREGCEGPEAPRLSALVPFWQVGVECWFWKGWGLEGGWGGCLLTRVSTRPLPYWFTGRQCHGARALHRLALVARRGTWPMHARIQSVHPIPTRTRR